MSDDNQTGILEGTTIGFIGSGAMGSAMIGGLLSKNLIDPSSIIASDIHPEHGERLTAKYGIRFTTDNLEAAEVADILILSVKPQVLDRVLAPFRGRVDHVSLILSIVAGARMRGIIGELLNSRVVRAMPNTPGQIGEAMTVWCAAHEVLEKQRQQAKLILGALGDQLYVEDERLLDMATALNGSGPAYVFLFMEAMIDAGVRMGFSHRDASRIVMQTFKGATHYAQESGLHPALLRNQVTSPGGTTAAALYELEKQNFRTAVAEGIHAAYTRSLELAESDD
ncbi:MAG: pyrroline-5-carboxylate reductase [Aggregatilineales bacterium]